MSPDENINSVVNMMDALTSAPDKYIALQNLKSAVFSIHPSALDRVNASPSIVRMGNAARKKNKQADKDATGRKFVSNTDRQTDG